jgi:hypothetical protein
MFFLATRRSWGVSAVALLLGVLMCAPTALAGPATGPAATTQGQPEVAAPATRAVFPLPPGYDRITAGGRLAYVLPADEAWVKAVLEKAPAVTRPSTMPDEVLTRVKGSAPALVKALSAEVGLSEAELTPAFQEFLVKPLAELSAMNDPVPVWVISRPRLLELVKSGGAGGKPWVHPRFRYNRVADDVSFSLQLSLGEGTTEAERIIPALIDDAKPQPEREAELTRILGQLEQSVAGARSGRGMYLVQRGMIQMLGEKVVVPLKLAPEQQWFGLGLIGVVSARYTAVLTGVSRDQVLAQMTAEPRGAAFRASGVDLLKPMDLASMKPAYAMQYIEATRRKSVAVVDRWMDLAGSDGLAKTLKDLRETKPVGVQGLRDLVKKASGAELPVE